MENTVNFTNDAIKKIVEIMKDEANPVMIRAFVTGGGCSGFQYGFTFEETKGDDDFEIVLCDDKAIHNDKVICLVDSMSIQYLEGAQIDYKEDMKGAQFTVTNPNATSTCGCGNSFTV